MFKTIDEACQFVMSQRNENLGFNHFKEFIKGINNPQSNIKMIHVAGTNGKGSVVNYLNDCLMMAGYKVGMFVSPHYLVHQDRIRINSNNIDDDSFLRLLNKWYPKIIEYQLNMFQIDYLIMCDYFIENKVDIAIIETGIGGRLDSTNVIDEPLLSIIVTIGYDHQDRLGNTIEEIAFEKAGIIKKNRPVLIGRMDDNAINVIKKQCSLKDSDFYQVLDSDVKGLSHFIYRDIEYKIKSKAYYQIDNACVAIEALTILNKLGLTSVSPSMIKNGIYNSFWAGRFENIKANIYVDGAHNIAGIKALIASFDSLERPIRVVTSILKDKDYIEMLSLLKEASDELYFTSFDFYRSLDVEEVKGVKGIKLTRDYLSLINELSSRQEGSVVVCGSLYFVCEVIQKVE